MGSASNRKTAILYIAANSHHKPKSLCFICVCATLTDVYYFLFDKPPVIDDLRPSESHPEFHSDQDTAVKIIDSSCGLSIYYLLNHLQETEPSEFEAYLAVARNLVEKLSRLTDVINDKEDGRRATEDFEKSYADVRLLFEVDNPELTALELKKAKWLGRGTNRKNVEGTAYELLYAYVSRVLHLSNMDTLLSPKEDRFFVKAYILVMVVKLYHKQAMLIPYLSKESKDLHKKCYEFADSAWSERGVSPEILIYCTTYYDDDRTELETSALASYKETLQNSFEIYKKHGAHVLPKVEFTHD